MATPTPSPTPIVKVYYGKPMLPNVSRVLACLFEKEVNFNLIDMNKGKHLTPELIKFQASRAPVSGFEDGDTRLFESRAICRHIVDKYADRGNKYLLGKDLLERASIEQWLKSEEHSFDPPSWALVFYLAFKVESDQELIKQSEWRLGKVLDVYEQRLGESRFLAGDEFSLADLSHLPNSHYLARSKEWGHLFESRENVRRWWEKISSRASWKEVVKILNERGFLESRATKANTHSSTADENHKFLIHGPQDLHLSTKPVTNGKASSKNQEQNLQQADSARSMSQQLTSGSQDDSSGKSVTREAQTSNQSSAKEAASGDRLIPIEDYKKIRPTSQPEKVQNTKPISQVDSVGQSITQKAPIEAESSRKEATLGEQLNQKQEHKPPSMPQAHPSTQSIANTTGEFRGEQTPTNAKPASVSATRDLSTGKQEQDITPSSKMQDEGTQQIRQANSKGLLTTQQVPTDVQQSKQADTLGAMSSKKQQEDTQPIRQADFKSQQAPTDVQWSKQEKGTQPRHQADSKGQPIDQSAPSDVQQSKQADIPGVEKDAQPMLREDTQGQRISQQASSDAQQSTQADTPGTMSSKRQEEDTQPKRQVDSAGQSVTKQTPVGPLASNQSATSDASSNLKEETTQQRKQENSDGQSTPQRTPTDVQSSKSDQYSPSNPTITGSASQTKGTSKSNNQPSSPTESTS